jgi:hypothetical protein
LLRRAQAHQRFVCERGRASFHQPWDLNACSP